MSILSLYLKGNLTDEQAVEVSGFVGGWKRCSDLRSLGFISDTGERRTLSSGKQGMVCAITPAGKEALA